MNVFRGNQLSLCEDGFNFGNKLEVNSVLGLVREIKVRFGIAYSGAQKFKNKNDYLCGSQAAF
jgi:hypothetical protein